MKGDQPRSPPGLVPLPSTYRQLLFLATTCVAKDEVTQPVGVLARIRCPIGAHQHRYTALRTHSMSLPVCPVGSEAINWPETVSLAAVCLEAVL